MASQAPLAPQDSKALAKRTRQSLVREALIFQVKLAVDGLKDLVLLPMSLFALFFELLAPSENSGGLLRRVLRVGAHFDRWLDLYAPIKHELPPEDMGPGGFDRSISALEKSVQREVETGELGGKAKAAMQRVLEEAKRVQREARGPDDRPPGT